MIDHLLPMTRPYLTLLLMILSSALQAQVMPPSPLEIRAKLHPANLFGFTRPYAVGSVEFLLTQHHGLELGYGHRIYRFENRSDDVVNNTGRMLLAEYYYRALLMNIKGEKDFIVKDAWGITYRNIYDLRSRTLKYTNASGDSTFTDPSGIQTNITAICLRFGASVQKSRIGFEGYVESGYRHKTVVYKENTLGAMGYTLREYPISSVAYEQNKGGFTFNFAIKFSYRLL